MQELRKTFGVTIINVKCVCIHGFLGNPSDWMRLGLEKRVKLEVSYPNLLADPDSIVPYREWAEAFNSRISQPTILVGYSLGGRLAMHAALHSPHLYQGLVIISSHYGLTDENEKSARLEHDQKWANRFRKENWEQVIKAWNSQPVFQNDTHTFSRNEQDFSRESLARALDIWSLGRQENLKKRVEELSVPAMFVAGEYDKRYVTLTRSLDLSSPHSNIWIATESGHRVPWQQPNKFTKQLSLFIDAIQGESYASRNDTMESCQTI